MDIVDRLRKCSCDFHKDERMDAADEIDRLRAENSRLQADIREFRDIAEKAVDLLRSPVSGRQCHNLPHDPCPKCAGTGPEECADDPA